MPVHFYLLDNIPLFDLFPSPTAYLSTLWIVLKGHFKCFHFFVIKNMAATTSTTKFLCGHMFQNQLGKYGELWMLYQQWLILWGLFLHFSNSNSNDWQIVIWICSLLKPNDVKFIFICLYLYIFLCCGIIYVFLIFLLLTFKISLYILDTNPICDFQIFLQVVTYLFHYFNSIFHRVKDLNFNEFQLANFFIHGLCFCNCI